MGAASKQKGSQFERDICAKLGLWITGGKRKDVFWRSAMSGGRATVARKRGTDVRQAGDITAVAPEGHALTSAFYIECKFYKDLQFESFVLSNKGMLAKFWGETCDEANSRGKSPWLIAKQNMRPILLITLPIYGKPATTPPVCRAFPGGWLDRLCEVRLLDEVFSYNPPKEFTSWLRTTNSPTSASTGTEPLTRTRVVGRERL